MMRFVDALRPLELIDLLVALSLSKFCLILSNSLLVSVDCLSCLPEEDPLHEASDESDELIVLSRMSPVCFSWRGDLCRCCWCCWLTERSPPPPPLDDELSASEPSLFKAMFGLDFSALFSFVAGCNLPALTWCSLWDTFRVAFEVPLVLLRMDLTVLRIEAPSELCFDLMMAEPVACSLNTLTCCCWCCRSGGGIGGGARRGGGCWWWWRPA